MYRKNPLRDPAAAIHEVISGIDDSIAEKHRNFDYSLEQIYDYEGEVEGVWPDSRFRSILERLGGIVALEDIRGYFYELLEIVKEDATHLDELLVALQDRIQHIHKSRPVRYIKRRFDEIQKQMRVDFSDITFTNLRYDDYFSQPVDQFIYYYYAWSFWIYSEAIEKLLAATRAPDYFIYDKDKDLMNERHHEWALQISDEELASVRDDINSIITGRISYGQSQALREANKLDSEDVTKLTWSNGSASWFISPNFYDRQLINKYVHDVTNWGLMDANIIVVPYPAPIVELILSSLYPLPLYSNSLEGKVRRRQKGKAGPLVSDRNIKFVVRTIAKIYVERWQLEQYGEVFDDKEDNWQVTSTFKRFWEKLLEAKARQNEDEFIEVIKKFTTIELRDREPIFISGVYESYLAQLVNWFWSLQL